MKPHKRFSGTLAEAAAEPARTLSSWQGEGVLAAILQPPCRAGDAAKAAWLAAGSAQRRGTGRRERERFCHLLGRGRKKRKRDSFFGRYVSRRCLSGSYLLFIARKTVFLCFTKPSFRCSLPSLK